MPEKEIDYDPMVCQKIIGQLTAQVAALSDNVGALVDTVREERRERLHEQEVLHKRIDFVDDKVDKINAQQARLIGAAAVIVSLINIFRESILKALSLG